MLYAELLKKVDRLGHKVCVELVEVVVEERGKVLGQVIRLLETGAQAVGEGGDVGHVSVVLDFNFFFDRPCEVGVVAVKQPSENSLLNLLVVLLLKEIVL